MSKTPQPDFIVRGAGGAGGSSAPCLFVTVRLMCLLRFRLTVGGGRVA